MAFLRPDTDSIDGNWTNQAGNNTNLFDSLDESVASDTDYIQSPASPVNEVCKIGLSDPAGSLSEPFVLRYRFNNAVGVELTVRLMQGTTEIASWLETATGWTTQTRTLTSPQFAAMGGVYTNLFVELKANVAGPASFATIFGPDLHAWYDASDTASITHSSGAVSQWADKSGNGFHLGQSGSNKPAYSATGLGGAQPAIVFNAPDYHVLGNSSFTWPPATSEFAVFWAGRLTGTLNANRVVTFTVGGSDLGGTAALPIARYASDTNLLAYRNATLSEKAFALDTTMRLASIFAGGNSTLYLNNVAGTTVADTASAALATAMALFVGGGDLSGVNASSGPVCEVAIVKRAVTSGERSSVDAMLAAKWTA